jgi:hypothetical protein
MSRETRAIDLVGYLPLKKANALFKAVLAKQKRMVEIISANITPAVIRKDPAIQVFLAYFDIYFIYQPRFLQYAAFTHLPTWEGAGRFEKFKIDSRNLQHGLDCLRVGQYKQAMEFFVAENQLMGGKQFYATIGQAFVALETGRTGDMSHFFEMANSMASTEKEKIYITLLLSRYHQLIGHPWKADQVMRGVSNLYADCLELTYRQAQSLVDSGNGQQALRLIRKLAATDRRFFIAALMDPALFPVSGLIESMLSSLIDARTKEANENFNLADSKFADLRAWAGPEIDNEKELASNMQVIDNLRKQFERKSIYDVMDVAEKAKGLAVGGPRYKEKRLEEINEDVDTVVMRWQELANTWKAYPYKNFFKDFRFNLQTCKRKLIETRSVADDSLVKANQRLNEAQSIMDLLKKTLARMNRVKMGIDTLKFFCKKLCIAEVVLLTLAFITYPVLTILLRDYLGDDFVNMLRNPRTQRNCLFIIAALVSPFFALTFTIRNLK